ncbi:MAG: hypothetical protein K2F83_00955 [Oscillospiraceae bacterium]|nr:hypothetical protein [Oscillospiraceae bacterium]
MLEGYGQRVTLRGEEDREVRAFFQPIKEHKPGESPSPLGVGPEGLYLYLGPAGESLEGVAEVLWDGRAFEVLRHRAVPVGEQVMYRWALCRELDEVRA